MKILAIDTSLAAAAACVYDAQAGAALAAETVWQARGHDETIVPLIDRTMRAAGGRDLKIDRVAVTVGPGSFTGLRIGISAAKAIGLAFDAPVVGVSTLAAYVAQVMAAHADGVAAAAIDARHGRVFVAAYREGRPLLQPRVATAREAVRAIGAGPIRLAGPTAAALAIEAWRDGVEAEVVSDAAAPDITFVALLARSADPATAPPRPLYLNPPEVTLAPARAS